MSLQVNISTRTVSGTRVWEGTVTIPGVRSTKLIRKSDSTSTFSTRSGVISAANVFAKKYGFTDVTYSGVTATKVASPRRAAAKKVARTTKVARKASRRR